MPCGNQEKVRSEDFLLMQFLITDKCVQIIFRKSGHKRFLKKCLPYTGVCCMKVIQTFYSIVVATRCIKNKMHRKKYLLR